MSNSFICPACGHEHKINDLELFELYQENITHEYNCANCHEHLYIDSIATEWHFEVEIDE